MGENLNNNFCAYSRLVIPLGGCPNPPDTMHSLLVRRFTNKPLLNVNRASLHYWLRAETKPAEHRTLLLPRHVKKLIELDHKVTVEESALRCVKIEHYKAIHGCRIVPAGSWVNAPADVLISGLKELPEDGKPIKGQHLYFAHCYKGQSHAPGLLKQFKAGNGTLYDLEFLVDDRGKRVAAFGTAAGAIGMAVGAVVWAWGKTNSENNAVHPALTQTYPSYLKLADFVREKLQGQKPKILIVGAHGRVGQGVVDMCRLLEFQPAQWDLADTDGKRGPFPEVLDYDIFINAIYLPPDLSPDKRFVFMTPSSIRSDDRKLSTIVDISCDPNNPSNPLPIYSELNTFFQPSQRIVNGKKPLDLISIDHFPSFVPEESSAEFADNLFPHLVKFGQTPVWTRALKLFHEHLAKNGL